MISGEGNFELNFFAAERDALEKLCVPNSEGIHCDETDSIGATTPIFFLANLIAGVGGTLFWDIGISYLDDNVRKTNAPALISKHIPFLF